MKKSLFVFITILIFLFLTFLFGEIGIRAWDRYHGVSPLYTHNFVENIAVPNGYFNFDIKSNTTFFFDSKNPKKYSFNRWGFRAPEYDPIKPKNTLRVFFLGASPTFDPFSSNENSWVARTGKNLSQHTNKKIEAINAGRYGYTSHEIFGLFYHRILRHSPDLIVLYSTIADAGTSLSPYFGADDRPQLYGNTVLAMFTSRSAFFSFLDARLRYGETFPRFIQKAYKNILPNYTHEKKPPQEHYDFISNQDRGWAYAKKLFEKNINTIISIAREYNVKVLISTTLNRREQRAKRPGIKIMTESLRRISQERNVSILDMHKLELDDQFEKEILQSGHHLSPKGSEFLANHMADSILKNKLLEF